jgi:hypothetical protein
VNSEITYALLFRVPVKGVKTFQRYESLVLPLLEDHDGRLERRLRSPDRLTEVHIVSFPTRAAFAAYREDRRRGQHAHLLAESGAAVEVLEVDDV